MSARQWNRFYELFAASQGRTAAQQEAIDNAKHVGRNVEFMSWIHAQLQSFRRAMPEAMSSDGRLVADRAAWAAWLENWRDRVDAAVLAVIAALVMHSPRTWP